MPGGAMGLFIGLFAFMIFILYSAEIPPTLSTLVMVAAGFSVVIWFNTLYWPQMVLFQQTAALRIRNLMLFTVKHSVRVFFAVLIQLVWILLIVLFSPWALMAVPFLGFWFPIFLAQYHIYPDLNADLRIEEQFIEVEGDPWAKDSFEEDEAASRDPFLSGDTFNWMQLTQAEEYEKIPSESGKDADPEGADGSPDKGTEGEDA